MALTGTIGHDNTDSMKTTLKKMKMGRPTLGKEPAVRKTIRVPAETWKRWEKAAGGEGKVSEWLRRLADAAS